MATDKQGLTPSGFVASLEASGLWNLTRFDPQPSGWESKLGKVPPGQENSRRSGNTERERERSMLGVEHRGSERVQARALLIQEKR